MHATDSDAQLLDRWRTSRDRDAFAELVTRYGPLVYSSCLRVLRNAAAAEDAAQECFLELLHSGTDIRSLPGWLHTAATRRALDRLKAEHRRRERESRYAADRSRAVDRDLDDVGAYIDEAIEALPERLRRPVVLRFFHGRTYAEISTELALPTSTIQYRLKKGIEGTRSHLASRGIAVAATSLAAVLSALPARGLPSTVFAHIQKVAGAPPGARHFSSTMTLQPSAVLGGFIAAHKLAATAVLCVTTLLATTYVVTHETPAWIVEAGNLPESVATGEGKDQLTFLEFIVSLLLWIREEGRVVRTASPSGDMNIYVAGVVVDERQRGVPGALVEATWATALDSTIANEEGRFRFTFSTDFRSDGPLVFRRRAHYQSRTTTVAFRGQVTGDSLVGVIETEQGDRSVEGERDGTGSGAFGLWYTLIEQGDERFSGTLTISRDASGDIVGRWIDEFGPPELSDLGVPDTVTLSATLHALKAFPRPFDIPANGRSDITLVMGRPSNLRGGVIDSTESLRAEFAP